MPMQAGVFKPTILPTDTPGKIRCAWCLCFGFIVSPIFGFLFFFSLGEISRFQPFYEPIKCTGLYHYFPLDTTLDASSGVFDVKDRETFMECDNDNEYDLTIGKETNADILILPETIGMEGNELMKTGSLILTEDAQLPQNTARARFMWTMNWKLNTKYVEGLQKYLNGRLAIGDYRPRFPVFFTLRSLVTAKYRYIGASYNIDDVLPTLYCGFQMAFDAPSMETGKRGFAIPAGGIFVDTATICNPNVQKTLEDIQALPAMLGPKIGVDHNLYISYLNPTQEKLNEMKNTFDIMTCIVTGFLLLMFLIGVAGWLLCCCIKYVDEEIVKIPPPPDALPEPEWVPPPQALALPPPPPPPPALPAPEPVPVPVEYDEV